MAIQGASVHPRLKADVLIILASAAYPLTRLAIGLALDKPRSRRQVQRCLAQLVAEARASRAIVRGLERTARGAKPLGQRGWAYSCLRPRPTASLLEGAAVVARRAA